MRRILLVLCVLSLALPFAVAEEPAFTSEDILVHADGYEIPATLTLPKGEPGVKYPAVVMCHGNGSTRHEAGGGYDLLAPELAKAGIASIRFDYIGNGDSKGDYIDFTLSKGVEDANTCLEYLKTLDTIDTERVGIMGWSQGGGIALVVASKNDAYKSVLTWAGAMYDGSINEEQYAIAKEKGYYEVEYGWRDSLKQSPAYYEDKMTFVVASAVPLIKAPILAINGSKDDVVVPETAQKIIDLAVNPNSQALILEGADHTFNIFTGDLTKFNELMAKTIEWFVNTL